MLIDMHVAATGGGDGTPPDPRDVLDQAGAAGLDGILVIGFAGDFDPRRWLEARTEDDPRVFCAFCVNCARGRLFCVPQDPSSPPIPSGWSGRAKENVLEADEVVRHVRKLGAAVIAGQPYDHRFEPVAGDLVFSFEGIHAVEVRTTDIEPLPADIAIEAGLGMRLPCLAGTGVVDSSTPIGHLATLFPAPIRTQAELVEALQAGDAWPVIIERPSPKIKRRRKRRRLK